MQSLDEYLDAYGGHLAKRCRERLKPLHDPQGEPHPRVGELLRKPFAAQAHVMSGAAALLNEQKSAWIVAEMGSGKSMISLGTVHAHADGQLYRALVFCPAQLVAKWQREIKDTLPDVTTQAIGNWKEAIALLDKKGTSPQCAEWYVISQQTAKLAPAWEPAVCRARRKVKIEGVRVTKEVNTCPDCGATVADEDGMLLPLEVLERKPTYCSKCHGALWTWTDKPLRWPVATFVHKKLKGFFDYLIVDELHQEKSQVSAQANAVGSLAAACGRTIALTGTLLGGYSEDIRTLLFRLSPRTMVDEGFDWHDAMRFAERYGRIKTTIREKENEGRRNRQSRGSSSKTKQVEPGILPGLFGNHLLDKAIFLQLDAVAAGLPNLQEELVAVPMEEGQAQAYEGLETDMTAAIRDLVRRGNRQLLGSMVNSLLYYTDTCWSAWEPLGYYEGKRDGEGAFRTVHIPAQLSAEPVYPKEQALLDLVRREKEAGRQCWVYVQLTEKHGLLERLRGLFAKQGFKVAVLRATSVSPGKREEWIAKNAGGMDVILSHPKPVETGLDLFDKNGNHNFCTLIFYQTGYNLFTLRQASRRSWRIGQEKECKVVYFYYEGTMQERTMGLMGRKLAAAEAIDGKFSSEGLAAASEDEGSLAMMLAKNLMDKLDEDPALQWAKTGQITLEREEPMARKKFPKNAAKMEVARAAKSIEPAAVLPFVKPEPGMSNLAARLAKIRLGRQLMAAK
jgi:hypothetical protein